MSKQCCVIALTEGTVVPSAWAKQSYSPATHPLLLMYQILQATGLLYAEGHHRIFGEIHFV